VIYRVRAVNTAAQAENKIHDDGVAARYGFRGGLVPGVTIYGYMMQPILAAEPEWIQRGTMQLRLLEPFFDGDEVVIKIGRTDDGAYHVTAERADGTLGAKGFVRLSATQEQPAAMLAEATLPEPDQRPIPSPVTILAGATLGSLHVTLETPTPEAVLQLSNDLLIHNFRLPPWIHVSSELRNWAAAQPGSPVSVRGRVHDRFDRKGHAFIVADVMLIGADDRLIQTVRHTAIYRLREPGTQVIP
jgi:hypothetical protein